MKNPWIKWFILYMAFAGGNHAIYTLALPIRVFHHVIVTVILIYWLLEYGLPNTIILAPLALFCVPLALSVVTAIDPRMVLENAWHWLTNMLLFVLLIDWHRRGYTETLFKWQFYAGLFLVGFCILEYWLYRGRPAGPFFNINLVGAYAAALVIPAWAWRKDHKWLEWLTVLLVTVVLLNASRGAFLSLCVAGLVYGFMRIKSPVWRVGIVGMAGILIMAVLGISQQSGRQSGDDLRLNLWRAAVDMGETHLFGVGPGLYGQAVREFDFRKTDNMAGAHNQSLNILAELGVLGLIGAWVTVLVVMMYARVKTPKDQAIAAALVGVAVHLMVDGSISSNFAFLVALYAAYLVSDETLPLMFTGIVHRTRLWLAVGLACSLIFLLRWDQAQYWYEQSLSTGSHQSAEMAVRLDPDMKLYRMNLAELEQGREYLQSYDETLTNETDLGIYAVVSFGRFWR